MSNTIRSERTNRITAKVAERHLQAAGPFFVEYTGMEMDASGLPRGKAQREGPFRRFDDANAWMLREQRKRRGYMRDAKVVS